MAQKKIVSTQIQKAIVKSLVISIKENWKPFLIFSDLLRNTRTILEHKIATKDFREAIGALKNDEIISVEKVAGREIFYGKKFFVKLNESKILDSFIEDAE
ncbi:MAG: hypothetical protein IBV52_09540 [Candidatus Bathyarchaeota archaeon]